MLCYCKSKILTRISEPSLINQIPSHAFYHSNFFPSFFFFACLHDGAAVFVQITEAFEAGLLELLHRLDRVLMSAAEPSVCSFSYIFFGIRFQKGFHYLIKEKYKGEHSSDVGRINGAENTSKKGALLQMEKAS